MSAAYLFDERCRWHNPGQFALLASVGGFVRAKVAAALVKTAIISVMQDRSRNAYALSRPAGQHAERDRGFCLLANIPIAVESARAAFGIERVAILDTVQCGKI